MYYICDLFSKCEATLVRNGLKQCPYLSYLSAITVGDQHAVRLLYVTCVTSENLSRFSR